MRKPRKLPPDALAPFQVSLPQANPWLRPEERAAPIVPIDWAAMYGNTNPVEVEVGFGKGLYLVSAGTANPDVNYFGIEIVRKYQLYATSRLAVRELNNVRTCCADAKLVLSQHIVPGSVRTVHVFFPDPWWKNRHKKRLLMTEEFVVSIARVLPVDGLFHFVTDVKDYFEMVSAMLAESPLFRLLPPPLENTPTHEMDYLTNFERKFRQEGRPIYRSLYAKNNSTHA